MLKSCEISIQSYIKMIRTDVIFDVILSFSTLLKICYCNFICVVSFFCLNKFSIVILENIFAAFLFVTLKKNSMASYPNSDLEYHRILLQYY